MVKQLLNYRITYLLEIYTIFTFEIINKNIIFFSNKSIHVFYRIQNSFVRIDVIIL